MQLVGRSLLSILIASSTIPSATPFTQNIRISVHSTNKSLMSTTKSDSNYMTFIEADTNSLFSTLNGLKETTNVYTIFKANWCPDCRVVLTVLKSLEEQSQADEAKYTVVICDIGERMGWRSGDHLLKAETGLKLKGIPTLMKFKNDKEESRLEKGLSDGSVYSSKGDAGIKIMVQEYLKKEIINNSTNSE